MQIDIWMTLDHPQRLNENVKSREEGDGLEDAHKIVRWAGRYKSKLLASIDKKGKPLLARYNGGAFRKVPQSLLLAFMVTRDF